MQVLIDYINKWLNERNNEQVRILESIKKIDTKIATLKSFITNPDNMDENLLNELVPANIKLDTNYNNMIQLKGWYATYAEQPQIKAALEYLSGLINALIKDLKVQKDDLYGRATTIIENIKIVNEKYKFILEYNEETYIDETKMDIISELVSGMPQSQDMVDLYIKIANNNNRIDKSKKRETSTSNRKLDEMNEARKRTTRKVRNQETLAKLRENLIAKVNNFVNNEEYKKKTPTLHGEISAIAETFETSVNKISKGDMKTMLDLIGDPDYIEICNNQKELVVFTTIGLINAYESNNVDLVNKFINAYKNSYVIKKVTLQSIDEEYDLYEKIEKAREIVHNYEVTEQLKNYMASSSGMEKKDILQTLKVMGYSAKDYYKGILSGDLKTLELKIKKLDDKVLSYEEVNSIIRALNNVEQTIDNIVNQDDEKKDNITMDSPYDKSFENYIVFLDPERMEVALENMETQHKGKMYNGTISRIQALISDNLNELRRLSSNIHEEKNKPNPYDVMATSGSVRVAYKVIENANIEGHNVILVISPMYAPTGSSMLQSAYLASLKEFSSNIDKYEQIQKELSGYKGKAMDCPYIRKSLETLTSIKERALEETEAIGGK